MTLGRRLCAAGLFSILPILFFLVLPPISTIPEARADPAPSLTFTTSAPTVRGYQGEGFYFPYNLTNNLHNQERLTNLTVSLDYGSFQSGFTRTLGSGSTIGYWWIPIPISEPTGNHTFHAMASFQYLDNNTNSWFTPSDSPQLTTGTLTVLPSPASKVLTNFVVPVMLPVAGVFAVPGILMGAFSIRRSRSSLGKTGGQAASLPGRNDNLFPLTITIFFSVAILAFDSLFTRVISTLWIDANILGFLLLMGSAGLLYQRGTYSRGSIRTVLFLSSSATVASTLRAGTIRTAGPCFNGLVGAGFPLPWAPFSYPPASYLPVAPFCPFLVIQPLIILAPLAFILDTLFYFAIGLCLIETHKILSHRYQ